jgi:hypothetical protein
MARGDASLFLHFCNVSSASPRALVLPTPSSGFCHSALDVPHSMLEVYSQMQIEPDSLPTGHAGIAARLKKGPTVHSSAWIVPGATVIGDVTIEEFERSGQRGRSS